MILLNSFSPLYFTKPLQTLCGIQHKVKSFMNKLEYTTKLGFAHNIEHF